MSDEAIQGLREALRHSPDNLPLLRLLARTLSQQGRLEEAEEAYRSGLDRFRNDAELSVGLAQVFFRQARKSHALAILETLLSRADCPPSARILYARAMVGEGKLDVAAEAYRRGVAADASLADTELEARLGEPRGRGADQQRGEERRLGSPHAWEEADEDDDDEDGYGEDRLPPVPAQGRPGGYEPERERPKVNFSDVGGMEGVKDEIRVKIVHPMRNPEIYRAYGKKIGGGVLMYGPPGCGKTHLARATAGEVQATFLSIGIHEVLDMWTGQSERNLHQIFETARGSSPCVLFFDEVDALGAKRTDARHSGNRNSINQFLAELDGVNGDNEGVLVLAATNAPWHLDPAFRRPGRFDRIIFVPPPDEPARAAILEILVKDKPVDRLDFEQIAKKTESFSGADLKAVVDLAVEGKLVEAMKSGMPEPLRTKDLLAAAKKHRPTTKEWFATAKNYAMFSNTDGAYDEILEHLKIKPSRG